MTRDFYTRLFLPVQYRSREHLIPRSMLRGEHQSDESNIVTTDIVLNAFRSNYRFAEISSGFSHGFPLFLHLYDQHTTDRSSPVKPFYSVDIFSRCQVLTAFRSDRLRLYYPLFSHYEIAQITNRIIKKYSYLDIEDVFENSKTFNKWLHKI